MQRLVERHFQLQSWEQNFFLKGIQWKWAAKFSTSLLLRIVRLSKSTPLFLHGETEWVTLWSWHLENSTWYFWFLGNSELFRTKWVFEKPAFAQKWPFQVQELGVRSARLLQSKCSPVCLLSSSYQSFGQKFPTSLKRKLDKAGGGKSAGFNNISNSCL